MKEWSRLRVFLGSFLFLFLAISVWVLRSKFGLAVDSLAVQSMEVSPPSQEIKGTAGSQLTVKAKLRNKSFNSINVKVRVEDFAATGQEGQVALVDRDSESLKTWSLLSTESLSLKPNEQKEVTALIDIPAGLVGGQYGAFVFSVLGSEPQAGEAALAQEVASLFLIKLAGQTNENLVLTDFKVARFLESGPVPMEIKFKNSGNVHSKPFGLINVKNIFGKTVKDVVVKGETNILPGATRVVRASLEKKYLFGYYTAEALMNYGPKNESLSSTVSFWVIPVRIILAVILVFLIFFKMRKRIAKAWKVLVSK